MFIHAGIEPVGENIDVCSPTPSRCVLLPPHLGGGGVSKD